MKHTSQVSFKKISMKTIARMRDKPVTCFSLSRVNRDPCESSNEQNRMWKQEAAEIGKKNSVGLSKCT